MDSIMDSISDVDLDMAVAILAYEYTLPCDTVTVIEVMRGDFCTRITGYTTDATRTLIAYC